MEKKPKLAKSKSAPKNKSKVATFQLEKLLDNISDSFMALDTEWRCTYVNEKAAQILGRARKQLIGKNIWTEFPEGVNQPFYKAYYKAVETQQPVFLEEYDPLTKRWFEKRIHPSAEGLAIFFYDITERKKAKETLHVSESRYRRLLDANLIGIVIAGTDGRVVEANNFFLNLIGATEEELRAGLVRWDNITPPEWKEVDARALEQLSAMGISAPFEKEYFHKDGHRVPIRATVAMLKETPGDGICLIEDLTEHKQAEKKLRLSEEKYRIVTEASHDSISLVNRQFEIEYTNTFAASQFETTPPELIGRRLEDLFPPQVAARQQANLQKVFDSEEPGYIEANVVFKGSTIWLGSWLVPIRNDTNQVTNILIVSRDITKRKQAEDDLRENENKLRTIFETMSEGVAQNEIIYDENGEMIDYRILEVNRAFYSTAAYNGREVVGGLASQVYGMSHEFIKDFWKKHRTRDELLHTEMSSPIDNRWFYVSTSPFLNGKFVTTFFDITERKQAEETIQQYTVDLERRVEERTLELVHANRAKDEFLANMSHELRTPLNAVLNISESLADGVYGELDFRQSEVLRVVAESGRHLLSLIKDILDLSKIEAGKLELNMELISVDLFCQSSMRMISQVAFLKHLQVSMSNTSNIEVIYADERRLKQMLVNLLSNAVKFTPAGGQIGLEVTNEGDYAIRFSVWDSGIGIPADQLKQLFKPFVQLDSSLSRQYSGTGLGLSLVHDLAELHGGSVGVESKPGGGSRFYFIIPIHPLNLNTSIVESTNSLAQLNPIEKTNKQNGENRRILLVEDNVVNMSVTRNYLIDKGYQVIEATDGLEAIEQAQAQNPDLILMDIQMPGLSGLEAIKRLRAMPGFDSVPIVALTALAMPGDHERCLKAGANEYLSKPVSLKTMMEVIEKLM